MVALTVFTHGFVVINIVCSLLYFL